MTTNGCSLVLALALVAPLAAQPGPPVPARHAPSTADPADVASVDAIIKALYEAVGFAPGGAQDRTRMRSLFAPGARLVPPQNPARADSFVVWSVDDYLRVVDWAIDAQAMRARGFHEIEVARRSDAFGPLMHVFSTYESRYTAGDSLPFTRGINSIQLMRHAGRWWVLSIAWAAERPGLTIPAEYLRPSGP